MQESITVNNSVAAVLKYLKILENKLAIKRTEQRQTYIVESVRRNVLMAKHCVSSERYHDQLRHISFRGNKLLM